VFAPAPSAAACARVPPLRRLQGRYGARPAPLLDAAQARRAGDSSPAPKPSWAELRWAARAEAVQRLDDLLLRRTRIGLQLRGGGAALLPRIRAICQPELGWSDARWEREQDKLSGPVARPLQLPLEDYEMHPPSSPSTTAPRACARCCSTCTAISSPSRRSCWRPIFRAARLGRARPEDYWQALCKACQGLWAQPGVRTSAVQGVAVTTQRGTVVNLDRTASRCARPSPGSTSAAPMRYPGSPGGGKRRSGWRASTAPSTTSGGEAEINWIKRAPARHLGRHRQVPAAVRLPELAAVRALCRLQRLAGGLSALRLQAPPLGRARDWKWQALAVEPHMLPELVEPGEQLGAISRRRPSTPASRQGTPLLAAAADKACEVIGAGCREPHVGCLSYGTTATINTTSTRYVEVTPFIPPYPAAIPGAYSNEVQVFRGYWMVNWFKEQFGHHEQVRALAEDVAPEQLFDRMASTVPPGSMGLMLQPYWTPGIRVPGREAKGAHHRLRRRPHPRPRVPRDPGGPGLRAARREGAHRKRSGVAMTELRVSGGGSQSDCAMQLTADIFGLPTARPHVYETSGLGAAIDAGGGPGLHRDFDAAVAAMTRVGRVFEPVPRTSGPTTAVPAGVPADVQAACSRCIGILRRLRGIRKT
jgi:sugar (pentulose or hexulose) kinase